MTAITTQTPMPIFTPLLMPVSAVGVGLVMWFKDEVMTGIAVAFGAVLARWHVVGGWHGRYGVGGLVRMIEP